MECPENEKVSNYALLITNKRTVTRLRGIKHKRMEVIPLSLVAVLLWA